MTNWNKPNEPPPEQGEIWVRWKSPSDQQQHVSLAHYEPGDGFVFLQSATEPERHDCYTFDYIGVVTGWQPIISPPAEE